MTMININAAIIAIFLASSSCLVRGKSLRASAAKGMDKANENGEQAPTTARNLESYHGNCSFQGKTVAPGQWLQGPEKACMCDRFGSQAFVACVSNGAKASAAPGAAFTALGARQEFQAKDFVFDLLGSVPGAITPGGSVQALTVANLPSLAGSGVSYTLVNLEPCAINLPHIHPRATELIYVIHGKELRTAFSEENGGRVIVNDIEIGETTFFPTGLIHYQQNLSCEPVQFLAALSSEDPGVVTITTQFFQLPGEAVTTSLHQGPELVQKLIDGLPSNPAEGRKECLEKCGLSYSW